MERLTLPRRRITAVVSLVLIGLARFAPVHAQSERVDRLPSDLRALQAPSDLDQQRAEDTRREFRAVMGRYPPGLGQVLRLDPTLMTNAAYLAPYPALVTFLQRHPEVARYSHYFLDYAGPNYYEPPQDPQSRAKSQAMNLWRDVLTGVMVFAMFATALITITWLIRLAVNHRRWLRATKIQAETHLKLLDRFGANDDLLAYLQSTAGQNLLPPVSDATDTTTSRGISAPFGRILWSVQAGIVLTCFGAGLLIVRQYVIEEVGQMMLALGVLGISLGVGFGLAAGASYALSRRLGLFDATGTNGTSGT